MKRAVPIHRPLIPALFILMSLLCLFCMASPASAQVDGLDLNGTWTAGNYGYFFIRQIGDEIWWIGEDDPVQPTWAQVAHGRMTGRIITMDWIDVPKGIADLQGTVVLEATHFNELVVKSQTGGFGVRQMLKAKRGVEME